MPREARISSRRQRLPVHSSPYPEYFLEGCTQAQATPLSNVAPGLLEKRGPVPRIEGICGCPRASTHQLPFCVSGVILESPSSSTCGESCRDLPEGWGSGIPGESQEGTIQILTPQPLLGIWVEDRLCVAESRPEICLTSQPLKRKTKTLF